MVPVLEYKVDGQTLSYRWTNTVDGFNLPVRLLNDTWLEPASEWKTLPLTDDLKKGLQVDKNFYIRVNRVN